MHADSRLVKECCVSQGRLEQNLGFTRTRFNPSAPRVNGPLELSVRANLRSVPASPASRRISCQKIVFRTRRRPRLRCLNAPALSRRPSYSHVFYLGSRLSNLEIYFRQVHPFLESISAGPLQPGPIPI